MIEDVVKKTIETYDKIAEHYAKKYSNLERVKYLANRFMYCLNGNKILDIGCGHGRDVKYFSDIGFKVVGIDLSSNLLKIAKQNAPNAKILKMDMRKLGFHDEYFDGAWAAASFLHIPKKEAKEVLNEFNRVIKKDGVLFIAVKEGEGEKIVEERKNNQVYSRFFAFYEQKEFQNLVEASGFKIFNAIVKKTDVDIWISLFARKI